MSVGVDEDGADSILVGVHDVQYSSDDCLTQEEKDFLSVKKHAEIVSPSAEGTAKFF